MQSELDQLKVRIENNNSVAAELEFKIRKLEPPDLASLRSDFAKLDMQLEKVKYFLSKVSPLRTQIQISDVLQRVLTDQSVQAKLIELENDRVSFLTKRQISCEQWCEWAQGAAALTAKYQAGACNFTPPQLPNEEFFQRKLKTLALGTVENGPRIVRLRKVEYKLISTHKADEKIARLVSLFRRASQGMS